MPGKITLKVTEGTLHGAEYPFTERTICVIGRAPDCNIQLPDDKKHATVSRYHCLLDINPPEVSIRDFGSLNGTYVNGNKIGQRDHSQTFQQAQRLHFPEFDLNQGDQIKLGSTVFEYSSESTEEENLSAAMRASISKQDPLEGIKALLDHAEKGDKNLLSIRGYTLKKELGKGTMGAVYLATKNTSGKDMALKVMLPQVAGGIQAEQIFLREAENTKALKHPNIVRLYDSGCSDSIFFFTMEYCDGGNVDELMIKRGGTLPLTRALRITLDVLSGLSYAHNALIPVRLKSGEIQEVRGLVHRDLKPANIFLSGSGNNALVKIADFGLAKAFDTAGLSGRTATGKMAGSPAFMPRQQVIDFKFTKPQVDVWAVAACFYNMVTGCYVRDYAAGRDPWLTTLQSPAVPIRKRNPKIPVKLAKVIDKALIDQPKIPFKSAMELKRAIENAI